MKEIMKKYLLQILTATVFSFAFSGPLFSQTVMGFLRDGATGDPLTGIDILVNGSTTGVSTGPDGSYSITVEADTTITLSALSASRHFYVYPGNNLMNLWINPPSLPSDYDGNYYKTVIIGSQEWMAENLKTTRYIRGKLIGLTTYFYGEQDGQWPAGGDEANVAKFGRLYKLFTVLDSVCPVGWRTAKYGDWKKLTFGADSIYTISPTNYQDSEIPVAKTLASTTDWIANGTDGTVGNNPQNNNITGFTALPAGSHLADGTFGTIGEYGSWWFQGYGNITTATINAESNNLSLHTIDCNTPTNLSQKQSGLGNSIRCVRDLPIPTLITTAVSSITQNSTVAGGSISSDGGFGITSRGVCWNTSPNPTISNNHTNDGSGTGNYTSSLTGLAPNTAYYVRAFATNSAGTSYGNNVIFKTYKADAITDIDGNYYNIVKIGSQVWMAENLKTTRYSDSTNIPYVTDSLNWINFNTPAYCWYNNDSTNKDIYGALYNWYAADTTKLCPAGWHVPSDADWTTLTSYLGGSSVAGGKLKEAGTTHWLNVNTGATNESGFTALPGGYRNSLGSFDLIGTQAYWWSNTLYNNPNYPSYAFFTYLINTDGETHRMFAPNQTGFSIRCLTVLKPTIVTNIADDGFGSLRYAINYANSTAGVKDTITFNIPGQGPFTIQPLTPLPELTDAVVINGFTQPGASEANSILQIELNGAKAGTGANGLNINANNCTIKGLIIDQFSGNGIQITGGSGNQLTSNSIYSNGKLGIDLGGDGVTLNDAGDSDTGPNNLQNYPVLGSINMSTGTVTITGSLNSVASRSYNIQFFASMLADSIGYGEGQTYLGSATVTTGKNGNVSFTQTFPIKSSWGNVITATATDQNGNTSEFSKAIGGLQNQTVSQFPLKYTLNADGVPNITDGSDLNAVRAAFATWAAVSTSTIKFTDGGTTTAKYANATDGINLVSFEDDQFPFSYGVLAVAAKTLKIDSTSNTAQIIDADIVVNPEFVNDIKYNLGVLDNPKDMGYFDIQSVITHEVGHVLGLLHSGVVGATMFYTLGSGTKVRTLEQDDISWASYGYPSSTYNTTYGSISGNITYGYGGQPVAGALVYAINTATKDSVHAYSDASGNYLVPGLIPGSYYIYIEPLNGNVSGYDLRPGNISAYIYANTIYTDYPGEFYSGSSESNNETTDIQTIVNVTVGKTTTGINLITNQDHTPPFVVKARATDVSGSLVNILSNFSVRFSEPIDETTLSIGTCYLTDGNKTFAGSYTVLSDSVNVVMFDPDSVLQYNTSYTLHVTGGVTDLKGNALYPVFSQSFTTISADNVPPQVNEVIPASGATDVFITDNIEVFFSKPMNTYSVENDITVISGGLPIAGSFSWDNDNMSVTFTPSLSLKEGTGYTVTLPNTITDLSGNKLANSQLYSFTTVAQAAPMVVYFGPSGTGVPLNSPVVVDFSEPINTSTVSSGTFELLSGSTPVQGTFEFLNENSRVIFRPASDLNFSQTYTVILTSGIMDVSQPSLSLSQVTKSFTAAAKATVPDILYLDPPSGIVGAQITIVGTGFDPNPAKDVITFNGIVAPVKTATLTSLTTEVPLGAMSGPVQVSVNGTASDNTMYFYLIPQSLDPCSSIIANTSTGTKSTHSTDVTPDGTYAYVTNPDLDKVTAVNLNTLQTTSITVGNTPMNVTINPLGTRAYVTNFNSHTVSVIDLVPTSTTYNKVINTIPVGIQPYGIVVTPSGKRVYVADYYSGDLSMIDEDPSSGGFDHVIANVSTGTKPGNLAATPDGAMVLVTGDFGLKIIDSNPKDKDYNSVIANVSSGTKTKDVTVTPDAGLAIVLTEEGNLLVVNLHPENGDYSEAVIANVSTGTQGSNVKGSGDGLFVYVTDTDHDQLLVYQIGIGGSGSTNGSGVSGLTLTLHNKIPVGKAPEGLVIKADASRLYVIDTGVSGNREVTTVAICCGPITPAKAIGDLIISVQNMINSGYITAANGKEILAKLNSALYDLQKNSTKNAINDLNAFTNKVQAQINGHKITSAQGQSLINSANAIISQLSGTKSALSALVLADTAQVTQALIPVSRLGVIYPNPFSQTVTINYQVAENNEALTKVQIMIYDISGRLVSILVDEMEQQGSYTTLWKGTYNDGTHAPDGTYLVLFRARDIAEVRKVILTKPR